MKSEKGEALIYIIIGITILIIIAIFGLIVNQIYVDIDYGTKQGIIIDKKYNAPYTSTTYTTSRIGNSMISIPTTRHNPENYNIKIQKKDNSKTKECWIQITKEEYEKYRIGDYYGG